MSSNTETPAEKAERIRQEDNKRVIENFQRQQAALKGQGIGTGISLEECGAFEIPEPLKIACKSAFTTFLKVLVSELEKK